MMSSGTVLEAVMMSMDRGYRYLIVGVGWTSQRIRVMLVDEEELEEERK